MTNPQKPAAAHRDDGDLVPDEHTPAFSGAKGGNLARRVAARDEERNALGGDPDRTRATKSDKRQPFIPTRSDHEAAHR